MNYFVYKTGKRQLSRLISGIIIASIACSIAGLLLGIAFIHNEDGPILGSYLLGGAIAAVAIALYTTSSIKTYRKERDKQDKLMKVLGTLTPVTYRIETCSLCEERLYQDGTVKCIDNIFYSPRYDEKGGRYATSGSHHRARHNSIPGLKRRRDIFIIDLRAGWQGEIEKVAKWEYDAPIGYYVRGVEYEDRIYLESIEGVPIVYKEFR